MCTRRAAAEDCTSPELRYGRSASTARSKPCRRTERPPQAPPWQPPDFAAALEPAQAPFHPAGT
eukprot:5237864-Alexandrium_andersonii.AAC.1